MLDINLIRENPEKVKEALLKKMDDVDFTELLDWDKKRRELITRADELKAKRNEVSAQIPVMKKEGKEVQPLIEEMRMVGSQISKLDDEIKELDEKIQDFLSRIPNIPDEDVPAGGKENNEVVRTWGEKSEFKFEPKDHVELVESLGLVDYEMGVKLGGHGFWVYKGLGAKLEWALLNYFVQEHLESGYEFMLLPHILTYECGYTAGQFPKFEEDVFFLDTEEKKEKFLLPTAETALANIHRDEILEEKDLPKKYFGYTPCFRSEAGSYRTEERGMIRGHQFNKVEMFQYVKPEESELALEELIQKAERLVQDLGLHFQTSKLAARDCSAGMAKTYDIEVWIPSMGVYKEVSSASNARDYQARRGNIRYRKEDGNKEFVHTLNASGLATSRLVPAIVEQFQQEDGTVIVPDVLRKWMGVDVIKVEE